MNRIKCGRSVSVCVCVLMCMIYLAPAKAMDAPPTLQLGFWDICMDCVIACCMWQLEANNPATAEAGPKELSPGRSELGDITVTLQ